jgi:hypothetical protein
MTDRRKESDVRKEIAKRARSEFSHLGRIVSVGFLRNDDRWLLRVMFDDRAPPVAALPPSFEGYDVVVDYGSYFPLSQSKDRVRRRAVG